MNEILLVEDNPDDVDLTLRAFAKSNIANEVVVARDGVEALDYLFATGPHAGRASAPLPQLVLLDLKLPRIDGLQVLERVRANPRTRLLPVVILTSSTERVQAGRQQLHQEAGRFSGVSGGHAAPRALLAVAQPGAAAIRVGAA
jgi:CheY-like chemotaxis protein